jgi:hypothetical protein
MYHKIYAYCYFRRMLNESTPPIYCIARARQWRLLGVLNIYRETHKDVGRDALSFIASRARHLFRNCHPSSSEIAQVGVE